MKHYRVFNIAYDTDGASIDLPKELFFDVDDPDFDPVEELADMISDNTGFCVFSHEFEEVDAA
jgi:hypothetical protein